MNDYEVSVRADKVRAGDRDLCLVGEVGSVRPVVNRELCLQVGDAIIYLGMITVVTDVVRENNQTYRLGWTENSKDSTKMGVGSPEYILLFHKPQTDRSRGYLPDAQYVTVRRPVDPDDDLITDILTAIDGTPTRDMAHRVAQLVREHGHQTAPAPAVDPRASGDAGTATDPAGAGVPRVIDGTQEEVAAALASLPDRTRLRDRDGDTWARINGEWLMLNQTPSVTRWAPFAVVSEES